MSIRAKVISIVAAASLVAGASLAAAAPATADRHTGTPKVKGSTTITLDAEVMGLLAQLGASIGAGEGAKSKGSRLIFPVTGAGEYSVSHQGQLQITTSATTTTVDNPVIEWPYWPLYSAILEVEHPLFGPISLFTVSDLRFGKAKVKVNRKKQIRTSTQIIKSTLTVDAGQAGVLNGVLGTTAVTDGQVFGKTVTKLVVTTKCKNKACTR